MNEFVKNIQGSDNALENYFLELVVQKKVVDREIQEVLDVVEKSSLNSDYKILLKRLLFWYENLYFENWGTLQDGLLDAIKTGEVRAKRADDKGLIIGIMLRLVEEVFDIPDEDMYAFIILEGREDVEHNLITLMKRMLDHLEVGLGELLVQSPHLNMPIETTPHSEFVILQKNLSQFPDVFFETEKDRIASLKFLINDLYEKLIVPKKSHNGSTVSFSE